MLEATWLIPCVGGSVCFLAMFFGWRFFVERGNTSPRPMKLNVVSGDGSAKGRVRNRRATPRRKGNSVEVVLTHDDDKTALRGWVLDRSAGGICILTEKSVAEGITLRVRPCNASTTTPWTAIIVRSCRKGAVEYNQFELGCQFEQPPNYNLLMMFG